MRAEMLHEELGEGFFAKVKAADFNSLILRYRNQDAAQTISLDTLDDQEWCAYFGRFEPFPNIRCWIRIPRHREKPDGLSIQILRANVVSRKVIDELGA